MQSRMQLSTMVECGGLWPSCAVGWEVGRFACTRHILSQRCIRQYDHNNSRKHVVRGQYLHMLPLCA